MIIFYVFIMIRLNILCFNHFFFNIYVVIGMTVPFTVEKKCITKTQGKNKGYEVGNAALQMLA